MDLFAGNREGYISEGVYIFVMVGLPDEDFEEGMCEGVLSEPIGQFVLLVF